MRVWSDMSAIAGKKSQEVLEYLSKRRSVPVKNMGCDGPTRPELETILEIAARVPDHGKLAPFYFLVFEGENRQKAGDIVAEAFKENNPDAPIEKIQEERNRFMRTPSVVGVIYRPRKGKHPLWEQMLTVGAVCQNMLLAINAAGYAGQWLSEWLAYNDTVRSGFGLDEHDVVAGFIYIGSIDELPSDRERPELMEILNYWQPDNELKKGDIYHREKFGFPKLGFVPIKD